MLDEILPHLEKVKSTGKEKYKACCPVHNEKNPSMDMTEKDGKVLIHCHACGANGLSVVRALGLPVGLLFNDPLDNHSASIYQRNKLLDELRDAKLYVAIYEAAEKRGDYIKMTDKRLYRKNINKVEGITEKLERNYASHKKDGTITIYPR